MGSARHDHERRELMAVQWLTAVIDGRLCRITEPEYQAIRFGTDEEREAAITAALLRL